MTLEPGFTLNRFLGNCGCPLDSVPSRELCFRPSSSTLRASYGVRTLAIISFKPALQCSQFPPEVPQPKSSTVYHLISEQEKKWMQTGKQNQTKDQPQYLLTKAQTSGPFTHLEYTSQLSRVLVNNIFKSLLCLLLLRQGLLQRRPTSKLLYN